MSSKKYNVEPIEKYINVSVFRTFFFMIFFGRKKSIRRDLRWVEGKDWHMNSSFFLKYSNSRLVSAFWNMGLMIDERRNYKMR